MNTDQHTPEKNSAVATCADNAREIKLRTLSKSQLKQTLEAHQKWIDNKGGEGEKADLSFTDLKGVDLSHRVLNQANLQGANLTGADNAYGLLDTVSAPS